jgi:hypothetical protein
MEKPLMTVRAIEIVCSKCGSSDVVRDATAAWNVELQQWELCAVQDAGYCNECDMGEVELQEVPIYTPEELVAAGMNSEGGPLQ